MRPLPSDQTQDTFQGRVVVRRSYDAAQLGRKAGNWTPVNGSADSQIKPSLSRLRARSSDLVRNDSNTKKALSSWGSHIIGTGIVADFGNKRAQKAFESWIKVCDFDQDLDFYGLQLLVARTEWTTGECLIRLITVNDPVNPLRLQVLAPDYLDDTLVQNTIKGSDGYVSNGIEYNGAGQRVAYWIYQSHPNDGFFGARKSIRVPSEEIIHFFEKTMPGQTRGVPHTAASMMDSRDLGDYDGATLDRKIAEANIVAFVTTDQPDDKSLTLGEDDGSGNEEMAPAMVKYLRDGQDVKFNNPTASNDGEFVARKKHDIAAGYGVTYEMLTGDLTKVNYSSIRHGLIDFRKAAEQYQWLCFIPGFLDRVISAWVKSMVPIVKAGITVSWTTPKVEWVDPLKDGQYEQIEIAAGLKSWSEAMRARGENPDDAFAAYLADVERFKAAGLAYPGQAPTPAPAEDPPEDDQPPEDEENSNKESEDDKTDP